jgi:DNA invertase Pin-like site-specific DNA recombinase
MTQRQKTVALYLRVSSDDQTIDMQRRDLTLAAERHGWCRVAEFVDEGISGAKGRSQRPAFDRLCRAIARHEFDIVAAWSVDRLGRSLQDLVAFLGEVHVAGIGLYLDRQGLDTSTPAGKAMFQMLGVFAEFERAMIVQRVRAGIAKARAQGTRSGKAIGRPGGGASRQDRCCTGGARRWRRYPQGGACCRGWERNRAADREADGFNSQHQIEADQSPPLLSFAHYGDAYPRLRRR